MFQWQNRWLRTWLVAVPGRGNNLLATYTSSSQRHKVIAALTLQRIFEPADTIGCDSLENIVREEPFDDLFRDIVTTTSMERLELDLGHSVIFFKISKIGYSKTIRWTSKEVGKHASMND